MKKYRFKTTINCSTCIKSVTPFLSKLSNIKWEVDTNHKDKILSVEGDDGIDQDVINAVQSAGFSIHLINV